MTNEQLLQSLADSLLKPFFDSMPSVRVEITDDPFFLKSNALAFYRKHIIFRPDYLRRGTIGGVGNFDDVVDTLKHELTHAWVAWKGLQTAESHNEAFIRKAISLGLNLNGTLQAEPRAREIYDRLTGKPTSPPTPPRPVSQYVPAYKRQSTPVKRSSGLEDIFMFLLLAGLTYLGINVGLKGYQESSMAVAIFGAAFALIMGFACLKMMFMDNVRTDD